MGPGLGGLEDVEGGLEASGSFGEEGVELAEDHIGGDLLHAAVVLAGGEVAAVVAGAAGEAFAAVDGADAGAAGEEAAGGGGAEEGQERSGGQAGEVHGAGVVGDDGGASVAGGDDLGEGEDADGVQERFGVSIGAGKSGAGEVGADPGVVGAAEEEDFEVAGEEGSGDLGVGFDGPAAEGLLAEHVAGSAGDEGDAGAAVCRGWQG